MTQVHNEGSDRGGHSSEGKAKGVLNKNHEPLLRITTANSGTLLIRFTSQARFDGWMGLFSDEDRAALGPRSSSAPSVFVRHRRHSPHSPNPPTKTGGEPPETLQGPQGQNIPQGSGQSSTEPRGDETQRRGSWSDLFSFSSRQPIWARRKSTLFSSNRESRALSSTTDGYSTDNYSGQQRGRMSVNEWRLTNNPLPPLANEHMWHNAMPQSMNANYSEQPQSYHPHRQIPFPESLDAFQEQAMSEQDLERQHQQAPGDSTSQPYLADQGIPQYLPPTPQNTLPTEQVPSSHPTNPIPEAADDDFDDLYDPEFGIGGNGRRRCQPRTKFCPDIMSSGGDTSRPTTSIMSAITSGSSSTAPVIPSATVISAAAAAVSAGWSEREALSAAVEDPDLLLSKVTFNPAPSSIPSRRRRLGSRISFSSAFQLGSSIRARSQSSMNESCSPGLPDPSLSSGSSRRTGGRARSTGFFSSPSGRQNKRSRDLGEAQVGHIPEGSELVLIRSQSLSDRVLLGSPLSPSGASSSVAGERHPSQYSSPITASPSTRVASTHAKNGDTITTFANWVMSHASEPALRDTRLSPGGLASVVSPEEAVVAPLSQFPVGETSLVDLESSVPVLEPVRDHGSHETGRILPPVP